MEPHSPIKGHAASFFCAFLGAKMEQFIRYSVLPPFGRRSFYFKLLSQLHHRKNRGTQRFVCLRFVYQAFRAF